MFLTYYKETFVSLYYLIYIKKENETPVKKKNRQKYYPWSILTFLLISVKLISQNLSSKPGEKPSEKPYNPLNSVSNKIKNHLYSDDDETGQRSIPNSL